MTIKLGTRPPTVARLAGVVAAAATLVAVTLASASPSAYGAPRREPDRAAVLGWRLLSVGRVSGGGLDTVVALGRGVAWAGGSRTSADGTSKPVIKHWHGGRWTTSKLPSGLQGWIMALAASSWKDVWAFGSGNRGRGGYALRWNGRRWRIMKRWSGLTSVAGAVVRGPAD